MLTSTPPRGDTQQQRLLERLRSAYPEPVAFGDLRTGGIDFPAAIVSELELSGYPVDRVYRGGVLMGARLLEPERVDADPHAGRRRRPSWPLHR